MKIEDFNKEDLINEILKYQGLLAKAEVDIEYLEDYNDILNNMGKRYANTIAKAIEYIKSQMKEKEEYIHTDYVYEMLDILKGGNNE